MTAPKNTEHARRRPFTSATFVQDDNKNAPFPVILSVSEGSPRSDGFFFPPYSGKTYGPVLVAAGAVDSASPAAGFCSPARSSPGGATARIGRHVAHKV